MLLLICLLFIIINLISSKYVFLKLPLLNNDKNIKEWQLLINEFKSNKRKFGKELIVPNLNDYSIEGRIVKLDLISTFTLKGYQFYLNGNYAFLNLPSHVNNEFIPSVIPSIIHQSWKNVKIEDHSKDAKKFNGLLKR
jgi:hypothetical protein